MPPGEAGASLPGMKLLGLAALFAAGVLVAGIAATGGGAQTVETTTVTVHETTAETVTHATTETVHETTTLEQTTTAPATTVITTTTAQPTTTATTPTTTATTTSTASTSSGTPTWVWVVLALLAAAVIGLAVVLFTGRGAAIPDSERRQRLQGAVTSWTSQGWALLTETADTAVLQRGDERMAVSVDQAGQISTRLVTAQPPSWPGGADPNAPTERIDPNDPTRPS
jgi:hypothetical protein